MSLSDNEKKAISDPANKNESTSSTSRIKKRMVVVDAGVMANNECK